MHASSMQIKQTENYDNMHINAIREWKLCKSKTASFKKNQWLHYAQTFLESKLFTLLLYLPI